MVAQQLDERFADMLQEDKQHDYGDEEEKEMGNDAAAEVNEMNENTNVIEQQQQYYEDYYG